MKKYLSKYLLQIAFLVVLFFGAIGNNYANDLGELRLEKVGKNRAEGCNGVKAWEKLKNTAFRTDVDTWLPATSKWIDEGYEFVENSVGVLIKSNGDEVVEIVGDVAKLTKHKIVPKEGSLVIKTSDEINPTFPPNWEDPYATNFPVFEFKTASQENFVRVYKSGPSANPEGRWLVKQSEIQGMTPQQIKEYLALPGDAPDMIIDVNLPPDILVRTGKCAPTSGGAGGAVQFDIPIEQAKNSSWYSNARHL